MVFDDDELVGGKVLTGHFLASDDFVLVFFAGSDVAAVTAKTAEITALSPLSLLSLAKADFEAVALPPLSLLCSAWLKLAVTD